MKHIVPIGLASLAVVAAGCQGASAATNVLVPQAGAGAPYGARDPYACSSKTSPTSGAISAQMARQYFICGWEKVDGNGNLDLTGNVQLQVGRGVVPRGTFAVPRSDQDPKAKVYAIRGSYDWYMCAKQDKGQQIKGLWSSFSDAGNIGKNCVLWHVTNATGDCYRTTFGDWKCSMIGNNGDQIRDQPPPKG